MTTTGERRVTDRGTRIRPRRVMRVGKPPNPPSPSATSARSPPPRHAAPTKPGSRERTNCAPGGRPWPRPAGSSRSRPSARRHTAACGDGTSGSRPASSPTRGANGSPSRNRPPRTPSPAESGRGLPPAEALADRRGVTEGRFPRKSVRAGLRLTPPAHRWRSVSRPGRDTFPGMCTLWSPLLTHRSFERPYDISPLPAHGFQKGTSLSATGPWNRRLPEQELRGFEEKNPPSPAPPTRGVPPLGRVNITGSAGFSSPRLPRAQRTQPQKDSGPRAPGRPPAAVRPVRVTTAASSTRTPATPHPRCGSGHTGRHH